MVHLRRSLAAIMALGLIAPLAACGDDDAKPAFADPATTASSTPGASGAPVTESTSTAGGPVTLTITPATDKKNVPVSAEIGLKVSGGEVTSVTLTDAKGKAVAGELREDGSAWVPAKPLKTKQTYAAKVVATGSDGQTTTANTTFTTMGAPARETGTGLYLFDGNTYGVAMPVVVEFNPGIKKADRAAVQKRMFVETSPSQPGTWSWTSSGTQAYYRAPDYWQTGTEMTVRIAVGGLPTGGGRHGDQDRSAKVKIGRKFEMKVDNASKKMTVLQGDKVVKTIPVSLGKKSTPSSSGHMVVMEKKAATVFDTTDTDGADGYRTDIEYAQRLTWSGQYIHSAPWSTGAQGRTNVSHGCVNVSPSNARWLFGKTLIGDPVTVKGTGDELDYGNGWTPWDVSWEKFKEGSAL
ncbi:L,D-transpeptidase family protein [Actinoplanes hulinensis]|uniref:L,D-transpeptidase family protein n=1 Tax=Actinoplanes hulinensis TaxID=1144547 RepID=A0ABS7AU54_9ACTN|nr:Ig-like domain-containing protein [Actinoplanes hulinensis]MBW6432305.1 L,D-transpeptidase family protein [Actinoplanes hulinensis]